MMKTVKQEILKNLQAALVECNNADISSSCDWDGEAVNDLNPKVSRQNSAYGHISDAIREIGGDGIVDFWVVNGYFEEGEMDMAQELPIEAGHEIQGEKQ